MLVSVIITTYNQPAWLEKCLSGFARQTLREFEILVADDGSGPETRAMIEAMRPVVGVPVHHIWHADRGFRKCTILNAAILASRGDYLVFTDGDCIPRRDFLAVHRALAEPGRFLSGGYVKLPPETSHRITREDVLAERATDYRWLRSAGAPRSRRLLRLALGHRTARLLDRLTPTRPTWNGHNASAWRTDVVAVNGFEERMGYGGLDREFGERLENAGVRGKQIRHRAVVVHLHHERAYRDAATLERNREIRRETAAARRTRAIAGLDRHVATRS
ncbi:MAG TPA: glycosyltransferase family 2 protein [Longimicrobiales bacterium]